jgi:aspartate/methionine/tyrosine aminotransferase
MFLDVSKTGLSGTEFATKLLDTKYVAVVPGVGFSSAAEDFVRLSFATSEENIVEGINRIREFVDSVQKKN